MAQTVETIQLVWEKGATVPDNNPDQWRKDQCGAWIGRQFYGKRESQYGWEIDHIILASDGGTDAPSNLRPLQWENNASRQDSPLVCVVIASGKDNVRHT